MTTHERIHTGIIKFECRICDFKCNRFVWMEEHQKEEHGYICSVCQHKCAEWGALKDHTLQEHGGYLTSESNAGLIFVFFCLLTILLIFCDIAQVVMTMIAIREKEKNSPSVFFSNFIVASIYLITLLLQH